MKSPFSRIVLALVIFLGVLGAYWMYYGVIVDKSAEVGRLQSQIDSKTAVQARATSARATLLELKNQQAEVNKYFVSTDTVVSFLGDLENRGVHAGAATKVISVSSSVSAGHPVLQIALTLSGTFSQVMNAIGSIEYAPYDLSVSALALTQSGDAATTKKETPPQWNASLVVMVGSATGANATSSVPVLPPKKTGSGAPQ